MRWLKDHWKLVELVVVIAGIISWIYSNFTTKEYTQFAFTQLDSRLARIEKNIDLLLTNNSLKEELTQK